MGVRKNFTLLYIAALCCLCFAIFTAGQAFAEQKNEIKEYRIDIGDVLEINVWKEAEFTREVFVRMDGRISLPLIGDVVAAGKTPMDLAKSLEEKIGEIIEEPSVTVLMKATNSRVYYMVGNIRHRHTA